MIKIKIMVNTNTTIGFHGKKMVFIKHRAIDQRPLIEDLAEDLKRCLDKKELGFTVCERELILRN